MQRNYNINKPLSKQTAQYSFLFPLGTKIVKTAHSRYARVTVENKVARFLWPTVYFDREDVVLSST